MNHLKPDFIAKLTYRTTEEGGRRSYASSGYRPQVKFDFSDIQTSGEQYFLDKEIVYPGETVTAEITLITTEVFKGCVSVGMHFEFREASRVIGTGVVLEIVSKELEKV